MQLGCFSRFTVANCSNYIYYMYYMQSGRQVHFQVNVYLIKLHRRKQMVRRTIAAANTICYGLHLNWKYRFYNSSKFLQCRV